MDREDLLEIGTIEYREGHYEEALHYLSEAAEKFSPSPEVLFQLGNVLARLGRHEQAISAFRLCCNMEQSSEPHTNIGNSFMYIGDYASAIKEFEIALELNPSDHIAVNNLPICKKILKDIDKYSDRAYFCYVMQTALSMIEDLKTGIGLPDAKKWAKDKIKFTIVGYKDEYNVSAKNAVIAIETKNKLYTNLQTETETNALAMLKLLFPDIKFEFVYGILSEDPAATNTKIFRWENGLALFKTRRAGDMTEIEICFGDNEIFALRLPKEGGVINANDIRKIDKSRL